MQHQLMYVPSFTYFQNQKHIYATSGRVIKLFGGCLIVASKMTPSGEVNRDEIAMALGLSEREVVFDS